MANVIIGIHGLGNKPPATLLEKWWKMSMKEGLRSIHFKDELTKFEIVYWADIIHKNPLSESETDGESPYFIDEIYTIAPAEFPVEDHRIRKKVVDFLNRQLNRIFLNEDLTLNYSSVADAIVSKYFKDLEIYYTETCTPENNDICMAKDLIRSRLLKKLEKHQNDNIMLISHSMGSIIAFDVLTFLAPHIKIDTFITIGSPLGLPIVINKIASEQKKKHNVADHMITPPGITRNWYNFSDILDKVAFNYKLAGNFSENQYGVKPVDFLVVNNYMMNGITNPHKSYGYLRTPELSKILNEFIASEKLSFRESVIRRTSRLIRVLKIRFKYVRKKDQQ